MQQKHTPYLPTLQPPPSRQRERLSGHRSRCGCTPFSSVLNSVSANSTYCRRCSLPSASTLQQPAVHRTRIYDHDNTTVQPDWTSSPVTRRHSGDSQGLQSNKQQKSTTVSSCALLQYYPFSAPAKLHCRVTDQRLDFALRIASLSHSDRVTSRLSQ
jgi:hypothetical protein